MLASSTRPSIYVVRPGEGGGEASTAQKVAGQGWGDVYHAGFLARCANGLVLPPCRAMG